MRVNRLTLLPLTLSLVSGVAMATTVYKWVDAQGVIHFSDQPHPQAQQLDVQPKNLVSTPDAPAPSTSTSTTTANPPAAQGYRCDLIRPENDEVFLNTRTISARVRVQPDLAPGDQVAIAIDGKRVQNQPTRATEFVISDVDRGTHTIMVTVYDPSGTQKLCTTGAVTFHVRQPSVQAPIKSVRPKF